MKLCVWILLPAIVNLCFYVLFKASSNALWLGWFRSTRCTMHPQFWSAPNAAREDNYFSNVLALPFSFAEKQNVVMHKSDLNTTEHSQFTETTTQNISIPSWHISPPGLLFLSAPVNLPLFCALPKGRHGRNRKVNVAQMASASFSLAPVLTPTDDRDPDTSSELHLDDTASPSNPRNRSSFLAFSLEDFLRTHIRLQSVHTKTPRSIKQLCQKSFVCGSLCKNLCCADLWQVHSSEHCRKQFYLAWCSPQVLGTFYSSRCRIEILCACEQELGLVPPSGLCTGKDCWCSSPEWARSVLWLDHKAPWIRTENPGTYRALVCCRTLHSTSHSGAGQKLLRGAFWRMCSAAVLCLKLLEIYKLPQLYRGSWMVRSEAVFSRFLKHQERNVINSEQKQRNLCTDRAVLLKSFNFSFFVLTWL